MDVEEGARELVKDEDRRVEVKKGPLQCISFPLRLLNQPSNRAFNNASKERYNGSLTKPKLKTHRALMAWKSIPMPKIFT
jgi:hypothetical protein